MVAASVSMTIFVPLGSDVKKAVERLEGVVPGACPCGASAKLWVHDRRVRLVPLGDGTGADVEMTQRRYVCPRCGRRITLVPDCLAPAGRYPATVRDFVIREYLSGHLTYQQLAESSGCSKSTC